MHRLNTSSRWLVTVVSYTDHATKRAGTGVPNQQAQECQTTRLRPSSCRHRVDRVRQGPLRVSSYQAPAIKLPGSGHQTTRHRTVPSYQAQATKLPGSGHQATRHRTLPCQATRLQLASYRHRPPNYQAQVRQLLTGPVATPSPGDGYLSVAGACGE